MAAGVGLVFVAFLAMIADNGSEAAPPPAIILSCYAPYCAPDQSHSDIPSATVIVLTDLDHVSCEMLYPVVAPEVSSSLAPCEITCHLPALHADTTNDNDDDDHGDDGRGRASQC